MTIRAEGLAVLRDGARVAGPLDLDLADGEVGLLEGPSGCGKSTLLRALGGLAHGAPGVTVAGSARVAGLDPARASPREMAARVGHVFQVAEEQLLAFDVRGEIALRLENLRVPEAEGAPRVERAIGAWGLAALAERESATLSAGEAKRVALAAAMVAEPRALLLDEPFTGLDPRWRDALARDLRALAGRVTVLLAEHHASIARPLARVRVRVGEPAAPPPARAPGRPPRGEPLATFRGVSLARGGATLVREASVALGPGFVALVGWNGSGKSTILRALLGLDAPAEGRVELAGLADPHRAKPAEIARRAGYAGPLSLDLFTEPTVAREIALTPRALGEERFDPARVAAAFGLASRLDRHPLALSGGERQRLSFAAAFAHAPRVALLDEPTVGLDPASRAALLDAIEAARARGALVVAATHDEDLVARADRVLALHDAELVDAGAPETFFDGVGRVLGYRAPFAEVAA